jgi:hypothetical protein
MSWLISRVLERLIRGLDSLDHDDLQVSGLLYLDFDSPHIFIS